MSKKTRKKSSKPVPKSRKTPARKPPAAKTVSKATRRNDATSAKRPAAKTASKTAKPAAKATVRKPDKTAETAAPKASHKPTSKQLKSNLSAPTKPDVGTELVEGAMARPFSLPRDGGGNVSLADYAGKKLVLFFYPRADTPGCTREAIDFTRLDSAFADEGAAVLGISADTVKAQESFRNQLSVPLISDEQHEMLEAYGAWGEKSMYGRNFMGIIRTTVLIGANGRVAKIWRNVRVDGHADEVLAAVRAI